MHMSISHSVLTARLPSLIIHPYDLVPRIWPTRFSSSGSRWKQRQGRDIYARDAKVQGLKSRAAFKLLEMDAKYKIFRTGSIVIDLGYAPGSWSRIAMERTRPHGRVIGIDLIPAEPPRGVTTIQGDFLSPTVQSLIKQFIVLSHNRHHPTSSQSREATSQLPGFADSSAIEPNNARMQRSSSPDKELTSKLVKDQREVCLVDIVLSDMLMNTSGVAFRDHAGSMDLCAAALRFASDTLKPGGHLICKFYQGPEDKNLEMDLKKLFTKVHREKPESCRSESREAYFVALARKCDVFIN